MPEEKYNRDSALPDLSASAPVVGPLYENPTFTNLSPRVGLAWDVFGNGRTALRGGYGLYFNTNNHQNLIVTVTNPPFTPRPVIANPTFPNPPFDRASAISMRPVQYDLGQPARAHLQRQRAAARSGGEPRSPSATPARAACTCCAAATSTWRSRPAPPRTAARSSPPERRGSTRRSRPSS